MGPCHRARGNRRARQLSGAKLSVPVDDDGQLVAPRGIDPADSRDESTGLRRVPDPDRRRLRRHSGMADRNVVVPVGQQRTGSGADRDVVAAGH